MTHIIKNGRIKLTILIEWSNIMNYKIKKNLNLLIELLLIFSFYIIIGRLLIHSGDDWAWGGEIGMNRLENRFDNYNGRYFGNILEMIITRNMFFRLIIYAGINTGIISLMYKLLDSKFLPRYLFFMMLIIPIGIYGQTFGWLAGFANYNLSTFFLLLTYYLVSKNNSGNLICLSIFIVSLSSQFFVENVSIANVIFSFIFLILSIKDRKKLIKSIFWLAGSISGLVIMFMNTAYHSSNNMRGVSNMDISNFPITLITTWSELFVKDNAILLIIFAALIYFVNDRKGLYATLPIPIATYFGIRSLFNISYLNQNTPLLIFEFILITFFLFSLIMTVYKAKEIIPSSKQSFFYYLFSSVVLLGPFLALTPFGPRNILTSYVLLVLCLFEILKNVPKFWIPSKKVITILTLTVSSLFIVLHSINKIEENKRITELKKDISHGETVIVFPKLPFEFLGHDLTPPNGSVQSNRQKMYHNIPKNVQFKIIDYNTTSSSRK